MTPKEAADYILSGGTLTRGKLAECFKRLGFEVGDVRQKRTYWAITLCHTSDTGEKLTVSACFGGEGKSRCCLGFHCHRNGASCHWRAAHEMIEEIAEALETENGAVPSA